jgi:17beta-estradiol 17-dehydrogenase / very-long-chain 3-oxoacyl-CoA reductase
MDIQRDGLLTAIIYLLGILSCLSIVTKTTAFLLLYLRPSKLHRYLHDTSGKPAWALVTGASDGIGKQFSIELASHGFNVVLHGRNPTKLAAVKDDLARQFPGREFRSLIADASAIACNNCRGQGKSHQVDDVASQAKNKSTPPVDFEGIAASLTDINLTVLINNAGGNMADPSAPLYQFLQDTPEARLVNNVNLNAVFPLVLQSKLLPQLMRNSPSLIINIGSLSDNGLPMLASYASSKTFLNTLSRIISHELTLQGRPGGDVEVFAARVGETTATSSNSHPASLFKPDARTVARAVLARVGCGLPAVVADLPNALLQSLLGLMPGFVRDRAFLGVIRTKWMADQERIKKSG